jgi:hypothetical protein
MKKPPPNKKTITASIRGSVPGGKLKTARVVLSDTPGKLAGGFTEYDDKDRKRVVKIATPASMTYFDVAVRGHETRHATHHTLARKKPKTPNEAIAAQIVDDVNVECKPLRNTTLGDLTSYRRAHLCAAMTDLKSMVADQRRVKQGKVPDSAAVRNAALLCATRVTAMLGAYATDERGYVVAAGASTLRKGMAKLQDTIGAKSLRALREVIRLGKSSRTRNKAISMLTALLENVPDPENPEEMQPTTDEERSDIMMPVTHGDALEGKMEICDLRPKTVYCAREKSISVKHAPNGVIVNARRFVNAIVSGDGLGLFSRRLRQTPGGTVVIDASGSMGATARNLGALCKLVPTATVAYYSGDAHGKGILAVYAEKGKRYAGQLPSDTLRGGNAVDLAAVRWLMAHPKPWTLVSDLEFCGGIIGSETVAFALVERAEARGELTVYRSLDAAYEAFGGKGELPEDERE